MATHALLSLDKGNRASSWVWEFDPTHTLHTLHAPHTYTHTCCMCTLSCSSTGVTSTNAQRLMYPHFYQRHGSFSYAKPRLPLSGHTVLRSADHIDGMIRYWQDIWSSSTYLSEGFWWNSVRNLLASCHPRKYLVRGIGNMNRCSVAFPQRTVSKVTLCIPSQLIRLKKYFVLLSVMVRSISSHLMNISSICYDLV